MPPKRKAPTPETQYEIDTIIRERTIRGKKEYLVHWFNYSDVHNEWVPEENMHCCTILDMFKEKQKSANPGPMYLHPRESDKIHAELFAKLQEKQKKSSNRGDGTSKRDRLSPSKTASAKSNSNTKREKSTRTSSASSTVSSLKRLSTSNKESPRARKSISPTPPTINSTSSLARTAKVEKEDTISTQSSTSTELEEPLSIDDIDPVFEICNSEDNPFKRNFVPKEILFIALMGKKRFAAITFMNTKMPVLVDFDIAKQYDNMLNMLNLALITAPCYKMIAPGEKDSDDEDSE